MKIKKAKIASESMPRLPKDAPAPMPVPAKTPEDLARDGEHDLDHLLRSEDIKADPQRMDGVKKAHEKRMTGMRSIADLKAAGQALAHQKKKQMMGDGDAEDLKDGGADEATETKPPQPRVKQKYPKGA